MINCGNLCLLYTSDAADDSLRVDLGGRRIIKKFKNRILNIHPSILPAFPGLDAQRQAIESGVSHSGCTVHFAVSYTHLTLPTTPYV